MEVFLTAFAKYSFWEVGILIAAIAMQGKTFRQYDLHSIQFNAKRFCLLDILFMYNY